MLPDAQTIDYAERVLPPGHDAVHRCRVALAKLLELPPASPAHIEQQRAALNERALSRQKLARLIGLLAGLVVFFVTAFLLRGIEGYVDIVLAGVIGSGVVWFSIYKQKEAHECDLIALEHSVEPAHASHRIELANIAKQWPETRAALRRWTDENRAITSRELDAIRCFHNVRKFLEEEIRAKEAVANASLESPHCEQGAPLQMTTREAHMQLQNAGVAIGNVNSLNLHLPPASPPREDNR